MQRFCNFFNKIVKVCNIILIIGRNRKQKAHKSSCPNPAINSNKRGKELWIRGAQVQAKAKHSPAEAKEVPKAKGQNPRMPKQQEFNFISPNTCMTTAPSAQTILPSARPAPGRGTPRPAQAART